MLYIFLAFAVFGLRVYATHIEPNTLVVREVEIKSPKIFRPLRIVHLSDIQSGGIGAHEGRVFERIRELNPHLLLYTGDLVQPVHPATRRTELPKLEELFRSLNPPSGKYGVYGNIDRWMHSGDEKINFDGLNILDSEEVIISNDRARMNIYGLSELESYGAGAARKIISDWLPTAPRNHFTVVLGHWPNYLPEIENFPLDLCLAGHTHGGQIRLPFIGPIVTLSRIPRAWARGYRKHGNIRMNVSAGIGCERSDGIPSIRINCPPEMTLIKLKPR